MASNSSKVIVAVTGGIAAYKSASIVSQLVQSGHDVCVVMSPAAERFVGRTALAALSGKPVVTDLFDPRFPLGAHIELARHYETLCVAPATAHFLAAAAQGHADDLISTLYLCFTGDVWFAPAMNCEMWEKPAVQRNVNQLESDGVKMIGPEQGWLSCRVKGVGRMAEAQTVVAAVAKF